MTSGEKYKITEEDIKEYGGEGMCEHLEECGHKLDSKVCGLNLGWNHPQCPVNIEADERISKNPEYVAEMARGHEVAEHARQFLEKLEARKKEREGKKTE